MRDHFRVVAVLHSSSLIICVFWMTTVLEESKCVRR